MSGATLFVPVANNNKYQCECVLVVVVVGVLCENCIVDAYFLHFHRGQNVFFDCDVCEYVFSSFLSEKILFFFVLSVFCL